MKFYSQNDLINYWEGGKSYKQETDGGQITVISDSARSLAHITKKFFEVKRLYDAGVNQHQKIKEKMEAVKNGKVVEDAQYKIVHQGGRTEDKLGVFLHAFIDDCFSLWETPIEA